MSHSFRDKHIFAFYAEIQDGHQKWWENDFWEQLQITLFILHRNSIWCQKWRENHFWQKVAGDSTLLVAQKFCRN